MPADCFDVISSAAASASPCASESTGPSSPSSHDRTRAMATGILSKFPEYAGTKKENASAEEKELLLKARRQREHALKLKRRIEVAEHNVLKPELPPKMSLDPSADNSLEAFSGENNQPSSTDIKETRISDLRRPFGVYSSSQVHCVCCHCKENRETDLKADYYWAHKDAERALRLTHKQCLRTLPSEHNRLPLREIKIRQPKDIHWISPLQKSLHTAESLEDIFNHGDRGGSSANQTPADKLAAFKRCGSVKVDGFEELEKQIAAAELQIKRLTGSAAWVAEVVVVVSSIRVDSITYLTSYRLARFLECKGVEHFILDINADIGRDSIDVSLVKKLDDDDRLLRSAKKIALNVANKVLAPQVLVDGVPIGTYEELLSLEDDGDLDYILAREACANCLCDRKVDWNSCPRCKANFREIISDLYLTGENLRVLAERADENCARMKAPTPHDWERRRRHLGLKRPDENVATWFDEGEVAVFGQPSVGFSVEYEKRGSRKTGFAGM